MAAVLIPAVLYGPSIWVEGIPSGVVRNVGINLLKVFAFWVAAPLPLDRSVNAAPVNTDDHAYIIGTTKERHLPSNTPLSRPVELYCQGTLVAKTQSNLDGDYWFRGLNPAYKYVIVSYDTTHAYRAVIADDISPSV